MITVIKSVLSAFLMYSRIPVPQVEWKEENRRYALGFFPLVGLVTGIVQIIWYYFCIRFSVGILMYSAAAAVIPVIIDGGIHLDGFCDVTDAESSFGDVGKRLEIMKDPHIGSFSVLNLVIYFLLQSAFFSEIYRIGAGVLPAAFGYMLSRSMSGFSAVTFRSAKNNGTLQDFVKPSHRNTVIILDMIFFGISVFGMIYFGKINGLAAVLAAVGSFLYYRVNSYKLFGGTTGDVCGWFLQICEIWMLAAYVFSCIIAGGIR